MPASVEADGIACNSGEFDGLPTSEAIQKIGSWFEERKIGKKEVQFRLRLAHIASALLGNTNSRSLLRLLRYSPCSRGSAPRCSAS